MLTEEDKKILGDRDRKREYDRQRYTKRLELIAAAEQRANEGAKRAADEEWAEIVYDRLVDEFKKVKGWGCNGTTVSEYVTEVYGSWEIALERSQRHRTPVVPAVRQRKRTAAIKAI